jgi:ankyrin repeat protein
MKKLAVILSVIFIISAFNFHAAFGAEKSAGAEARKDNFRYVKFASGVVDKAKPGQPQDRTLLMLAIQKRQNGLVKILIEKGADVNAKNSHGQGALLIAIASGNDKIVKYLIDCGADVNAKDNNGRTPLFMAIQKNKPGIAKLLIERGADVNIRF